VKGREILKNKKRDISFQRYEKGGRKIMN